MKKFAIILVSLMTALTSFVPAQAMPTRAMATSAGTTEVQQVQYREDRRIIRRHSQRYNGRYDRRERYSNRDRWDRRDRYNDGRRYDRRRRNNGAAIIGGLAAGAIIGGAIASQNRDGGSSSCAARYRSYRASDNTYQPSSGPRRVCR
jgi:Ni/Co efflux regulator RcnB